MSNKISTFKSYDIQIVNVQPGDLLLVHIADDLDLEDCSQIHQMLKREFPDNVVLLANEHILKGMSIIRKNDVSIFENIDTDNFLDDVIKEHKNDFLY